MYLNTVLTFVCYESLYNFELTKPTLYFLRQVGKLDGLGMVSLAIWQLVEEWIYKHRVRNVFPFINESFFYATQRDFYNLWYLYQLVFCKNQRNTVTYDIFWGLGRLILNLTAIE